MKAYYAARHQWIATCYWNANNHWIEPIDVWHMLTAMIEEANKRTSNPGQVMLMLSERVMTIESRDKMVIRVKTLLTEN